jgi:LysM repeat protein
VIQAGDTLQSIADDCHLPVTFLAKANRIDVETTVQAGQRVIIPIPPFPPPSRFPYPPQVFPPPYN